VSHKILDQPLLYLSSFFEKNRDLYYDNLNRVRSYDNLAQWINFFLVGVSETAHNAIETLRKISILNDELNDKILKLGRRVPLAKQLLHYLYKFPTVLSSDIVKELRITKPTANALINEFLRLEILRETTGFKRNRIFVFEKYLSLFRD
jgi:Fic family protein